MHSVLHASTIDPHHQLLLFISLRDSQLGQYSQPSGYDDISRDIRAKCVWMNGDNDVSLWIEGEKINLPYYVPPMGSAVFTAAANILVNPVKTQKVA